MEIGKTHRGFDKGEFIDSYGTKCSLQESSSAMDDKIWFGIDDPNPQIMSSDVIKLGLDIPAGNGTGWVPFPIPKQVMINTRMHLTKRQVFNIFNNLVNFMDTGDLDGGYDYDFAEAYSLESFNEEDGWAKIDFLNMREALEDNIEIINESIKMMKEREEKTKKYLEGANLAISNLNQLIKLSRDE